MKKVIILIILSILILGGIFSYYILTSDSRHHNKAIEDNNSELCLKIRNEHLSASCLGELSIVNSDPNICIQSPKRYIMTCFQKIARSDNLISICNNINSEVDEYNCYNAFAMANPQISVCNSLIGEPKDFCYKSVAIEKNDISICEQLSVDSIYFDNCKTDVESLN